MTAHVDLAIAIPQTFPDRAIDPRAIRRFLARAEALNYQSAWVVNDVCGRSRPIRSIASWSDIRLRW